jgi:hypothetical protein
MNIALPRSPVAARLNAALAAVVVTLATLSALDRLAADEAASPLLAQTAHDRTA